MPNGELSPPSLLAEILAGLLAIVTGVAGFVSAQVWSNTRKLYALGQSSLDQERRLNQYGEERLQIIDEIRTQLKDIERRLATIETLRDLVVQYRTDDLMYRVDIIRRLERIEGISRRGRYTPLDNDDPSA